VKQFLVEQLSGVSLDDLQSPSGLRPDYLCLNGLLAVELKSLEEDGSARMENLVDELEQRDDWPVFFGMAPLHAMLKNTNDSGALERRALDRMGRGILNHLKKANRQLEAHRVRFPRRSAVRMLLLVNEDHPTYDPQAVSYILWHAMRRRQADGQLLYEHVDLAMYLTERHAQTIESRVAFPVVLVEGQTCIEEPWKSQVGALVSSRWAAQYGPHVYTRDMHSPFSTIEQIPKSAPRHEWWRINYRRRPYLADLTDAALRDRFDELMVISMLGMVKGSPVKVLPEAMTANMERFTHLMEEMNGRGIPITRFQYTPARESAAAKRLGFPESVVRWIESKSGRPNPPEAAD
jgi:hypothetical protein